MREFCLKLSLVSVFMLLMGAAASAERIQNAQPRDEVPLVWTASSSSADLSANSSSTVAGRRLAVLLVDRSGSMRMPFDAKLSRWQSVLASLGETLRELERVTPGIEVEVRFFDNFVDSETPIRVVLDGRPSASGKSKSDDAIAKIKLMREPFTSKNSNPKLSRGDTAVYEAVSVVADEFRERFASGGYEWGFFALYSDGEDTQSSDEFKVGGSRDYQRAVAALTRAVSPSGGQVVVVPVGAEANAMLRGGTFKGFEIGAIGATLPKPPPPPCRVALALRAPFTGTVQSSRLIKSGETVAVPIVVVPSSLPPECAKSDLSTLADIEVRVAANSPFRLQSGGKLSGAGGIVEVVATESGDAGAVLRLEFRGSPKGAARVIIAPTPLTATVSFRPAVAPPDAASWKVRTPSFVRAGDRAELAVDNLDDRFRVEWTLQDGAASTHSGLSFEHAFKEARLVKGTLVATSADGKTGRRDFEIDVIDGAFEIVVPSKASFGKPCFVEAKSKEPGSTFRWEIQGKPFTGARVSITPTAMGDLPVRCIATTAKGNFEFTQSAIVAVAGMPRVIIAKPDSIREGDRTIQVQCSLADVEGEASVRLSLDGREIATKRPEPVDGLLRVAFDISLSQKEWDAIGAQSSIQLKAEVVEQGLSDEREISIVAIDGLGVQMRAPTTGTVVTFGENCSIELEVTAANAADLGFVESLQIRAIDANGQTLLLDETSVGAGIERAAPDFKLAILPVASLHKAPLRIEARIKSSRLRPRNDWILAGELGLAIAKAQFAITTVEGKDPSTQSYSPLTVKLGGIPAGERVKIEWSIDGKKFGGDEVTPTIAGLPPGSYRLAADVTRADGSQQQVGPTGMEVRSSLKLEVVGEQGKHSWSVGDPPAATITLTGATEELAQIASVVWTGADALPSDTRAAQCSFPAAVGSEKSAMTPKTVTAIATFKDASIRSAKLLAVVTPNPAPPKIEALTLTVGGNSESARTGGVVTLGATPGGVWSSKRITYTYQPTTIAADRGFEAVTDQEFSDALQIAESADGTYTFTCELTPYGGGAVVQQKISFVKLRQLDWLSFLALVGVALALSALIYHLNTRNGGLRWEAVVADSRTYKNRNHAGVTPTILGRHGSPRWSLWSKTAEIDLFDISTAGDQFYRSPRLSWVKKKLGGAEQSPPNRGSAFVRWKGNDQVWLDSGNLLKGASLADPGVKGMKFVPPPIDASPSSLGMSFGSTEAVETSVEEAPAREALYLVFREPTAAGIGKVKALIWFLLLALLFGAVAGGLKYVL